MTPALNSGPKEKHWRVIMKDKMFFIVKIRAQTPFGACEIAKRLYFPATITSVDPWQPKDREVRTK